MLITFDIGAWDMEDANMFLKFVKEITPRFDI